MRTNFQVMIRRLICSVLIGIFCTAVCAKSTVHLYVSPEGSDDNSGLNPSSPLKTLHRARDLLNEPNIKGNEVFVELMEGYHDLPYQLNITQGFTAPVTFRSYQHQEVHVTGGKRIDPSLFKQVTDPEILNRIPTEAHKKVRQIHLPDAGITDYGTMSIYGFHRKRLAPLEMFINGSPLRLARWPNNFFINIVNVPDGRRGVRFVHNTTRDSRWVGEQEPWVYGYWYFSWADQSAKVASINTSSHMITITEPTNYGLRIGHLRKTDNVKVGNDQQGGYFRVLNMLSELDQPGEYYIDRSTGILYLWPNTPTGYLQQSDVVYASLLDDCITLEKGVHNVTFEDFTLEVCRRQGIYGSGLLNVTYANMEVKNVGSYALVADDDSRNVTVAGCEIHDTDGGISVSGGDRINLIPSGNVVEDNHVSRVGRETSVGANHISHSGVHNEIRYNYLHHGTYNCILWAGNDHVMEYNRLQDCCQNSTDCGAFMCDRDWSMRGNYIRYNYFYDTIRTWPGGQIRGIMLDDEFSSVTIEKNVFFSNEVHANIGGGRDNTIRYNLFYNASETAVDVDGRGLQGSDLPELEAALAKVPYTDALWSSRYPKLAAMAYDKMRGAPRGNQIYNNLYYKVNDAKFINYHGTNIIENKYFNLTNNYQAKSKTDFVDPDNHNYSLQGDAKQWAENNNFEEPIPFDKVGPRYTPGPQYLKRRNGK